MGFATDRVAEDWKGARVMESGRWNDRKMFEGCMIDFLGALSISVGAVADRPGEQAYSIFSNRNSHLAQYRFVKATVCAA